MRCPLRQLLVCTLALLWGCSSEPLRPLTELVFARFDPEEGVIPMPTNLLRDNSSGLLTLPDDDADKTAAERELYTFMNTLEGWPASTPAEVEFSGPLALNSITKDTVQVWQWLGGTRTRVPLVTPELSADGRTITIAPPQEGWTRGATIVVFVRGGRHGVMGIRGEPVECDPAFYYLRLDRSLTPPEQEDFRAFPGETRGERRDTAEDLEELRIELQPYFVDLEQRLQIPRQEVAALWAFSVNRYTEVLMDKESGKMPLPIDLLKDPQTGKLDIPLRETDSERIKTFKQELQAFDGFGTTNGLLFELNGSVDPDTLSATTVQLYQVDRPEKPIPVRVILAPDQQRAELEVLDQPLAERTTYAVVIRPGVQDIEGRPLMPMLTGHFLKARHPLVLDGVKQIDSMENADADKLERSRSRMAGLMDHLGRENVQIAWPFTTMSIVDPLQRALNAAETHDLPVDPKEITTTSAAKAVLEFPIGALTVFWVDQVIEGKIATPDFIEPVTRSWYPDGSHKLAWVNFTMTIPRNVSQDEPLPVVIFAHAICTERRFVLAVADALAMRGYAAIAIDLPFHGTRTHCAWDGPLCFPDPLSKDGSLICPDPCESGSTCSADGKCRNSSGTVTPHSTWPILPFNQASGAAFIEIANIAGTRHHFSQGITDLGSLSRSLRKGDWKKAIGYPLKTDELYFLGQSLGGIIGGTYAALDPYVKRAVLNVPGANVVPMFINSDYFGLHVDAFLQRESIAKDSAEYQRFVNVARMFTDAVDPLNVARYLQRQKLPGQELSVDRRVLIQMAKLDFIIPNMCTEQLSEVADVPRIDYWAEHAFLVIPVEPAYITGIKDAAEFIEGSFVP